jgi:hypothetical protein
MKHYCLANAQETSQIKWTAAVCMFKNLNCGIKDMQYARLLASASLALACSLVVVHSRVFFSLSFLLSTNSCFPINQVVCQLESRSTFCLILDLTGISMDSVYCSLKPTTIWLGFDWNRHHGRSSKDEPAIISLWTTDIGGFFDWYTTSHLFS